MESGPPPRSRVFLPGRFSLLQVIPFPLRTHSHARSCGGAAVGRSGGDEGVREDAQGLPLRDRSEARRHGMSRGPCRSPSFLLAVAVADCC